MISLQTTCNDIFQCCFYHWMSSNFFNWDFLKRYCAVGRCYFLRIFLGLPKKWLKTGFTTFLYFSMSFLLITSLLYIGCSKKITRFYLCTITFKKIKTKKKLIILSIYVCIIIQGLLDKLKLFSLNS